MSWTSLRIALLGSSRHAMREPFAGGLEAFTFELAAALTAAGHRVTMFAAPGSAVDPPWEMLPLRTFQVSEHTRQDLSSPDWVVHETHAYLSAMLELAGPLGDSFDVVHNHSLHYLPLAMARMVRAPMLTTLHTPPLKWLEQAVALPGGVCSEFAAVSAFTAGQWEPINGPVSVIPNGVDLTRWRTGPGGSGAVWTGRLVPEKGVTKAIAAARRAGFDLKIAGPIPDADYFDAEVRPLLGDSVRYVGHLRHDELNELVGGAAVALVTPVWDEPFGLVVAEALASGTPVAAFGRGGIAEIVDAGSGVLAPPGDIEALTRAMVTAADLPRAGARTRAERYCCLRTMTDRYVRLYEELIETGAQLMSA